MPGELGAAVELHATLPGRFRTHDPALVVRAEVRRADLTFTGAAVATEAFAALGVELRRNLARRSPGEVPGEGFPRRYPS